MPDNTPLAKRIYDTAHITGDFTLRSGAKSTEYFDKYLFESNPDLLKHIAIAMVPLVPPGVDALAGLEMGGIPILADVDARRAAAAAKQIAARFGVPAAGLPKITSVVFRSESPAWRASAL